MSRYRILCCAVVAALSAVVAPVPLGASASTAPPTSTTAPSAAAVVRSHLNPHVLTTFAAGTSGAFAESVAVDRSGTLFVSVTTWKETGWNVGQIWKVTPAGTATRFGPALSVGTLTGLAFDTHGRLYAGLVAWQDPGLPPLAPGILRFDRDGHVTRVATLPTGTDETASFPNGLAVHGSDLYVSDTVNGAIWRIDLRRDSAVTLTRPWVRSSLLAPSVTWEGVNGIAFQGNTLVAVVSDVGRVVRIPIVRHGAAGSVSVVTRSAALVGADGVAFDTAGRLWVVVNHAQGKASGMLAWVGHNGAVQVVAKDPTWLDYPTQVAFAPQNRYGAGHLRTAGVSDRAPEGSTLYITNGAFTTDGVSDVTAVHVGAVGARLP